MKRPKTIEDAMKLPIMQPWENPYLTEFFEPDDLLEFQDEDGNRWYIVKTKEGYGRIAI